MDLSELTVKRKRHIQSCRENDDKSHDIIAGLYSDPSHFVYELLQNADDAKASKVVIELNHSCLKIVHNGLKLFNYSDIESITTVGSSTKKDDLNAIGKFGAGFKSVFAITKSPTIHSGKYHFRIDDFIVPEEIDAIISGKDTIIILPFNHQEISCEEAYQQIAERLKTLEAESLLFVRNIREIQWNTEEDNGRYLVELNGEIARIICRYNDESQTSEYLKFTNSIDIEGKELSLSVIYAFDSIGRKIKALHDTKLFVFFPTNERTGLNFIVHAPYKTTPSRESIPFGDSQNMLITNTLSDLVCQSLFKIKDLGHLNTELLTMLPINKNKEHPIYHSCYKKIKYVLQNDKVLPTSEGAFSQAEHALLAGASALAQLLVREDCIKLFNKPNWLDPNITSNKTRELREYLIKELGIEEINMEKFCSKITKDFVKHKDDDWLIHFYSNIIANKSLYSEKTKYQNSGILRRRSIIRLEDGKHIQPENEKNELQVYLPPVEESEFKVVKREIVQNEKAFEFLEALGLKEPDKVAEIKEFIAPRYAESQTDIQIENYLRDFIKVFQIWNESDKYGKLEIIDILKSLFFVGGKNFEGKFVLEKPQHVYLKTKQIENWFEGNKTDPVVFLLNRLGDSKYRDFLERLGLQTSLRIQKRADEYEIPDRRYIQRVDNFNPNLFINGLEYSVANITFNRSIFLWDLLLSDNPKKLFGFTKKKTRLADDFTIGDRENSKILEILKDKHWLFDKSKKIFLKSVSEISLDELHDDYSKDHSKVDRLVEALGLKLNVIKQFEKENPNYVVITKSEKEEFEQLRLEKQEKEHGKQTDNAWNPKCNPNEVVLIDDTKSIKSSISSDLSDQNLKNNAHGVYAKGFSLAKVKVNLSDTNQNKKIGDYGEELANSSFP